jgi:hypothetical protein
MNTSTELNTESNEMPQQANRIRGFVGDAEVFKTRGGESLIHKVPGNMRIELHVNLYKKILGMEFTPKEPTPRDPDVLRSKVYGFIAQPEVFLTRDKKYLIHKVLGARIVKSISLYKKILGASSEPVLPTL